MALTEWHVLYDIQLAAPGYNGVKSGEKFRKGETLGTEELGTTGLIGQVFNCKLVKLKAEGEEEAIKIAGEAYSNRGGVGATPHAEKELKFFSA